PAAVYSYAAHGDWFLLYLVTTDHLSLLWIISSLVVWMCLGAFVFWCSARWLQMGMRSSVVTMGGMFAMFAAATWIIVYPRISMVGTKEQWHRHADLESIWHTQIGFASVWIVIVIATAFWLLFKQLQRARA